MATRRRVAPPLTLNWPTFFLIVIALALVLAAALLPFAR